jgi:hypothetical protein
VTVLWCQLVTDIATVEFKSSTLRDGLCRNGQVQGTWQLPVDPSCRPRSEGHDRISISKSDMLRERVSASQGVVIVGHVTVCYNVITLFQCVRSLVGHLSQFVITLLQCVQCVYGLLTVQALYTY